MVLVLQIFFVVVVVVGFLTVYSNLMLIGYLRTNHRAEWEKLNKPTWAPSASKEDNLRLRKYLGNQEYLALNDPKLNSLAGWKSKISLICILSVCLYAGMFLAYAFKR